MKNQSHCFDASSSTVQIVPLSVSDDHISLTTKKEMKIDLLVVTSKHSVT